MRAADVIVAVRDANLERVGTILPTDLNLTATLRHNNVGVWKLTLRGDHPMADTLRTPGAGVIVSVPTDPTPAVPPTYAATGDEAVNTVLNSSCQSISAVSSTHAGSNPFLYTDPVEGTVIRSVSDTEGGGWQVVFGSDSLGAPGDLLTYMFRARVSAGRSVIIRDGGSTQIGDAFTASGDWEWFVVQRTVGGSTSGISLRVQDRYIGTTIDVSDAFLAVGDFGSAGYWDGDRASDAGPGYVYAWNGTPGESASTRTALVVTDPGSPAVPQWAPLFSGPRNKPVVNVSSGTGKVGTLTVEGVTDECVLGDAVTFPDPTNGDATTQASAYDTRTGPVESLMHAFVDANLGPSAPASRRNPFLTMGADGARGGSTTISTRFKNLGEVVGGLASSAALGFRVVQVDDALQFQTFEPVDRSGLVRMSVFNGGLQSYEIAETDPGVTHVLVAGQGEGADRQIVERTTPALEAWSLATGRRIEVFLDQRQTDDPDELATAGDAYLAENGATDASVTVVPVDSVNTELGKDWGLGDQVAVIVEDQEAASTVTEVSLQVSADVSGVRIAANVGTVEGYDLAARTASRVTKVEQRVALLETVGGAGTSSAADADTIVLRDGNGNAEFADPVDPLDAVNLQTLAAAALVRNVNVVRFTADGTYTPPANLLFADVMVVGAGGGGSGAETTDSLSNGWAAGGGGGGGGSCGKVYTAAELGSSPIAVVVGVGGTGGSSSNSNNGTDGTAASFGALSAGGGEAGGKRSRTEDLTTVADGGSGGYTFAGSPDWTARGARGGPSHTNGSTPRGVAGGGGGTHLSPGTGDVGVSGIASGRDGYDGADFGPGCGGSGGYNSRDQSDNAPGGDGAPGVVIVTEFLR